MTQIGSSTELEDLHRFAALQHNYVLSQRSEAPETFNEVVSGEGDIDWGLGRGVRIRTQNGGSAKLQEVYHRRGRVEKVFHFSWGTSGEITGESAMVGLLDEDDDGAVGVDLITGEYFANNERKTTDISEGFAGSDEREKSLWIIHSRVEDETRFYFTTDGERESVVFPASASTGGEDLVYIEDIDNEIQLRTYSHGHIWPGE